MINECGTPGIVTLANKVHIYTRVKCWEHPPSINWLCALADFIIIIIIIQPNPWNEVDHHHHHHHHQGPARVNSDKQHGPKSSDSL